MTNKFDSKIICCRYETAPSWWEAIAEQSELYPGT